MVYDEWVCDWEERTEGRRWWSEVSYSFQGWTSCVSTPIQLSKSLLWLNTLSIGSGTYMPVGSHSGVRSF